MNTRGEILIKYVLGIVIAALCITVFVVGASRLYLANVNQESENAKHLMDVIIKKVEALSDGQSASFTLQGFEGAGNWYLTGWSLSDTLRPNKCFLESCICICKGGSGSETCQNNGFCRMLGEESSVQISRFDYEYTRTQEIPLKWKDANQPGDYRFAKNALVYYKSAEIDGIALKDNLFELEVKRMGKFYVFGKTGQEFFGSVDLDETISSERRSEVISFLGRVGNGQPYKIVFQVQNSFKDDLNLDSEYYKRLLGVENVEFVFID